MHAYIHVHACIHTCTYIHAFIHTCIHAIHTGWTSLQVLHVHENQIEALPEDFGRLRSLRRCKGTNSKKELYVVRLV